MNIKRNSSSQAVLPRVPLTLNSPSYKGMRYDCQNSVSDASRLSPTKTSIKNKLKQLEFQIPRANLDLSQQQQQQQLQTFSQFITASQNQQDALSNSQQFSQQQQQQIQDQTQQQQQQSTNQQINSLGQVLQMNLQMKQRSQSHCKIGRGYDSFNLGGISNVSTNTFMNGEQQSQQQQQQQQQQFSSIINNSSSIQQPPLKSPPADSSPTTKLYPSQQQDSSPSIKLLRFEKSYSFKSHRQESSPRQKYDSSPSQRQQKQDSSPSQRQNKQDSSPSQKQQQTQWNDYSPQLKKQKQELYQQTFSIQLQKAVSTFQSAENESTSNPLEASNSNTLINRMNNSNNNYVHPILTQSTISIAAYPTLTNSSSVNDASEINSPLKVSTTSNSQFPQQVQSIPLYLISNSSTLNNGHVQIPPLLPLNSGRCVSPSRQQNKILNKTQLLEQISKNIQSSNYKEVMKAFEQNTISIEDIQQYKDYLNDNNTLVHILALKQDSSPFLKHLDMTYQAFDFNIRNGLAQTPLILSSIKGNYDVCRFLLCNKSVDVNSQDMNGNTALHMGCYHNQKKIVEILLNCKQIVFNLKNQEDKQPKDLTNDSKIQQLFLKYKKLHYLGDNSTNQNTINTHTMSLHISSPATTTNANATANLNSPVAFQQLSNYSNLHNDSIAQQGGVSYIASQSDLINNDSNIMINSNNSFLIPSKDSPRGSIKKKSNNFLGLEQINLQNCNTSQSTRSHSNSAHSTVFSSHIPLSTNKLTRTTKNTFLTLKQGWNSSATPAQSTLLKPFNSSNQQYPSPSLGKLSPHKDFGKIPSINNNSQIASNTNMNSNSNNTIVSVSNEFVLRGGDNNNSLASLNQNRPHERSANNNYLMQSNNDYSQSLHMQSPSQNNLLSINYIDSSEGGKFGNHPHHPHHSPIPSLVGIASSIPAIPEEQTYNNTNTIQNQEAQELLLNTIQTNYSLHSAFSQQDKLLFSAAASTVAAQSTNRLSENESLLLNSINLASPSKIAKLSFNYNNIISNSSNVNPAPITNSASSQVNNNISEFGGNTSSLTKSVKVASLINYQPLSNQNSINKILDSNNNANSVNNQINLSRSKSQNQSTKYKSTPLQLSIHQSAQHNIISNNSTLIKSAVASNSNNTNIDHQNLNNNNTNNNNNNIIINSNASVTATSRLTASQQQPQQQQHHHKFKSMQTQYNSPTHNHNNNNNNNIDHFSYNNQLQQSSQGAADLMKYLLKVEQASLADQSSKQQGLDNYKLLSHLGNGNYGDVYLVKHIKNNQKYAMKLLDKEKLTVNNMMKYAISERNIMAKCKSPFIVKMYHSFQTESHLVIVMEYCPGGDLYSHLLQKKKFDEDMGLKYLSEILLAVQELHYNDVIYRDMKPENIVLTYDGHVKLIDFGLSKENLGEGVAQSFCGSAVYLAPEIISKKGHNKSVDWYQFGVLAYELLVGQPPFNQVNRKELYYNIQNKLVDFPTHLSSKAKSLIAAVTFYMHFQQQFTITKLLNKIPEERLGSGRGDAEEIKNHPFFESVNWFDVSQKVLDIPAPFAQSPTKEVAQNELQFPKIEMKEKIDIPNWYYLDDCEFT